MISELFFLSSKHIKTHQNLLIPLSSPKIQDIFFIPDLLLLGSLFTWDAWPWCRLLCAHLSPFLLCVMIRLPCLLCHLLAFYASLHAYLHVHAWVLLASVSPMLQHTKVMNIWSKPTFVPRGYHLLFAFLFVCLFACYLAYLPSCLFARMLAMSTCLSALCLFHTLFAHFPSIACLLVSCLCLCMYTHGARTLRARARSLGHKQKRARVWARRLESSGYNH